MQNFVEWTDIQTSGYPIKDMDTIKEICLITNGKDVYQAIWCNVGKQWLNTDCRPFYNQWKFTKWAILNK